MRATIKLLPLALAATVLAAHAADEVVRIGSASPASGPSAHLGKDTENGARMAVADSGRMALRLSPLHPLLLQPRMRGPIERFN